MAKGLIAVALLRFFVFLRLNFSFSFRSAAQGVVNFNLKKYRVNKASNQTNNQEVSDMSGVNRSTHIGPNVSNQVVKVFDNEAKEAKDNVIAIKIDESTAPPTNGALCFTATIQSPRTGEIEYNSIVCQNNVSLKK
jgi:hypothetical protein